MECRGAGEPAMQTGRIQPKGAPRSLPSQSAPRQRSLVEPLPHTDPCLSKLCSDYQNLISLPPTPPSRLPPPTHSKSKCAIKNAHLSSSSRLPNAYASYLGDRAKRYCKRYGISFIRYTIQISSGGGCWVSFFSSPPCLSPRLCKRAD